MKIIRKKVHNPLAEDFAKPRELDEEVVFRKLTVVEELLQFMKRQGINRSQLAERMNVPPSRITKMLSGDSNLTIDTLVRAGRAVGADLAQTFVPQGFAVHWHSFPKAAPAIDSVTRSPGAPIPTPQGPSTKIPSQATAKKAKTTSQNLSHVADPKANYNASRKSKKPR